MESAREPFVDLEIELDGGTQLRFVFINVGGSAARNIRFCVKQDCEAITEFRSKTSGIRKMQPIADGISYLPAGQRLVFWAGSTPQKYSDDKMPRLILEIQYRDDTGRDFTRVVDYDLRQFDQVLFESFKNNLTTIAKAIRETEDRRWSRMESKERMRVRDVALCPTCKEVVLRTAKKCPHCQEWIFRDAVPE